MHHMIALAVSWVMPTHTWTEALAIILRWIHLLAGITWIGLLYFFNLVNVPFMKQVDAGMKPKVFQYMTLPTLQWFRWSALVTVIAGFWYWAQIYVAADAERMGVSPLGAIGLFLLIWIVTWGILYFVISKTPSGYVLGALTTILVILAGWLFVNFTPVGQDDNHVLSIGIGGVIDLFVDIILGRSAGNAAERVTDFCFPERACAEGVGGNIGGGRAIEDIENV